MSKKINPDLLKVTVSQKKDNRLHSYCEAIYFKLSEIYSSPFCCSDSERESAIKELSVYIQGSKTNEELLFKVNNLTTKMEQLVEKADMKQKLVTLIKDRYWERTFRPNVVSKIYNINDLI